MDEKLPETDAKPLTELTDEELRIDIEVTVIDGLPDIFQLSGILLSTYFASISDDDKDKMLDEMVVIEKKLIAHIEEDLIDTKYLLTPYAVMCHLVCAYQTMLSYQEGWKDIIDYSYNLRSKIEKRKQDDIDKSYG